MLIKQIWLSFLGFCSGVTVSAGVFGFITMLGIIPRMAARTRTASHIYAYEQAIILGGTLGNLWIPVSYTHLRAHETLMFQWHLPLSLFFIILFGLFSGIFVGCLAMALAEVLRVIPIMVNRLQIQEGLPVLIGFIAAGKCLGTLFQYFFGKMG